MTLQVLRGRVAKMTANRPPLIPSPPSDAEAFKQAGRLFLPDWAEGQMTPEHVIWWNKYGLKDCAWL